MTSIASRVVYDQHSLTGGVYTGCTYPGGIYRVYLPGWENVPRYGPVFGRMCLVMGPPLGELGRFIPGFPLRTEAYTPGFPLRKVLKDGSEP